MYILKMGIVLLENIETWSSSLEQSRALFEKIPLDLFSFVQQFLFFILFFSLLHIIISY